MTIDKVSSERLSLIRFPLIVGVVFIHAYSAKIYLSSGFIGIETAGSWVSFCQDIISQGVSRIAVPLFFLLSGYFFFLDFNLSKNSYIGKIKSRIKTLLIPFLFWNLTTLVLVGVAQSYPLTEVYFSGENAVVFSFGIFDYFNAIFGINRMPISYQFWFIRDLMIIVLISPVIYLVLSKIPKMFLLVMLLLWFLNIWPIYMPSLDAFVFFYIGAYFSFSNTSLFIFDRFGRLMLMLYTLVLFFDTISKKYEFNSYIHNAGILLGITSMLYITRKLMEYGCIKKFLLWASACSFFVFAIHEPLLTIVRKVIYVFFNPDSNISIFLCYIFIPSFVVAVSVVIYIILNSFFPKFLKLVSGGR